MRRQATILGWAGGVLVFAMAAATWAAEQPEQVLLPEGTMLRSVDGVIQPLDSNDLWRFAVTYDVNDMTPKIAAGTTFALLPSATLATLVVDANDREAPRYRLTGQITQYQGTNFLWVSYYVPLSKLKEGIEPTPVVVPKPPVDVNEVAAELKPTDDDVDIPEGIAERLKSRRVARAPLRPASETMPTDALRRKSATRVLVDAVGFIERREGHSVFVPDALGRNVATEEYGLLPCRALERAEQRIAAWPEPVRLQVAGVVTEYRGKKYLLLQRVIRAYNYGNFGG